MGLQPLLCFLPSPGWFLVTMSPPAKTTATAWLRSPEMREAAATCEIRTWYHLSGRCESTQGGHRQHWLLGSGGGWGRLPLWQGQNHRHPEMGPCHPICFFHAPHTELVGPGGFQFQPPELAGLHALLWVPLGALYQGHFWDFPQG